MKHGMFIHRTWLATCMLALSQAATAGSFDAGSCGTGRDQNDSTGVTSCRVTVPNGDFAGAPPPAGGETGNRWHPWEPAFSWTRITPRIEHPIGEHLLPWAFHGEGAPSYPRGLRPVPGVVMSKPGDAIFQWVPIPEHDGDQTTEMRYVVRVSYAPYSGRGSVGLGMRVIVADGEGAHVTEDFEDTKPGTPERPATFEAVVNVPAHTPITQLGVAVGKTGDAAPLLIREIAIVEMTSPAQSVD